LLQHLLKNAKTSTKGCGNHAPELSVKTQKIKLPEPCPYSGLLESYSGSNVCCEEIVIASSVIIDDDACGPTRNND